MSRSGTARIEGRLKQKIKDGEYYEAHQMYRTIFARQKQNKQLSNALRIVHEGAIELFKVNEIGSAGDLCILYCNGLDEISSKEEYEKLAHTLHQQCQKMHLLTLTHLAIDQPERDQFEKRVITWSAQKLENKAGSPVLREMIGDNYWQVIKEQSDKLTMPVKVGYYALARNNYLYARNGIKLAELLVELTMLYDDGREGPYFCALAMFQLLCDNCPEEAHCFFRTFVAKHPKCASQFPFEEPLLNLGFFLFEAIKMKNEETFLVLYQHYSPVLNSPDKNYAAYMRKIGTIYFGIEERKKQKPAGGLMGMIQNMMSEFGGDDSDDEENGGGLNNLMSMASNMLGQMSQPQQQPKQQKKAAIVQEDEDVDDLD